MTLHDVACMTSIYPASASARIVSPLTRNVLHPRYLQPSVGACGCVRRATFNGRRRLEGKAGGMDKGRTMEVSKWCDKRANFTNRGRLDELNIYELKALRAQEGWFSGAWQSARAINALA